MKARYFRALLAALTLLGSFSVAAEGLTVVDPWVRAAPPNAPVLGVFMGLENHSADEKSVVAARTTLAVDRVELHRTIKDGEVMKMVPQENIPVAPQATTFLQPGSWHIMLIGPQKVPAMGEKVSLTLVLDDGSEQTLEAVVRKGKMMGGHKMQHK